MTARISLNLGRTGGHRPPLQLEHFFLWAKPITASRGIALFQFFHSSYDRGRSVSARRSQTAATVSYDGHKLKDARVTFTCGQIAPWFWIAPFGFVPMPLCWRNLFRMALI